MIHHALKKNMFRALSKNIFNLNKGYSQDDITSEKYFSRIFLLCEMWSGYDLITNMIDAFLVRKMKFLFIIIYKYHYFIIQFLL